MVIGFSGSKSGTHVGAFYAARLNSGYLVGPVSYKTGLACYYPPASGSPAPWGDYSATCVDPADDTKFWTAQEYAESHLQVGPNYNAQWGTFLGKIGPN